MKIDEFNISTSTQLFEICQKVIQFRAHIEHMYSQLNANSLSDLPPSMIPTDTLYEVLVGFSVLFDKCLISDLIKSGSKIQYKNRIQ